jgi:hypothetical protein
MRISLIFEVDPEIEGGPSFSIFSINHISINLNFAVNNLD